MIRIFKVNFIVMTCFSMLLLGCGNKGNSNYSASPSTTPNITTEQALSNKTNSQNTLTNDNVQKNISSNTKKPNVTPPAAVQNLRFVVLADSRGSDNGVNTNIVNKIMTRIKQMSPQPQFAIMPGDLVGGAKSYKAVKNQLQYFKKIITKYYPPEFFYPGVGNHEVNYGVNGEQALGEVFGEFKATFLDGYNRSVYYFDKGNSRFFMLNTDHPGNTGSISQTQLSWTKKNIVSNSKNNLFFFHEPAYPTGPHVGSSLDSHPLQRDELWQIIDQSNNPIVFCGHEHFYTRRHINSDFNESVKGITFKYSKNVYQVTVGSFGAPLYTGFTSKKDVDVPPISQYHYAVVDIANNTIKTTVFNVNGEIIDAFVQKD